MKTCRKCKINKDYTEFSISKRDGYQSDCKECQSKAFKELHKQGGLFLSTLDVPNASRKDKAIYWGITNKQTVDRFLKKLRYSDDECLEYTGADNGRGYGQFTIYKDSMQLAPVKAHRFAYALAYGFDELPNGGIMVSLEEPVINHICHNRKCVNPTHLEVITNGENLKYRKPVNA